MQKESEKLMSQIQVQSKRNQFMECAKLIASFFVVFIHVPFPGELGGLVACIARMAVPMFFAISGYFSFQLSSQKIEKRMKHIVWLILIGSLVRVAEIYMVTDLLDGGLLAAVKCFFPDISTLATYFFLNESPFGMHLWYLNAVLFCYFFLWLYSAFAGEKTINYKSLYTLAVVLLFGYFAASTFANAVGTPLPIVIYRNAIFLGLPTFTLGIFIREYWQRILENFRLSTYKLLGLIIIGIILSVIEWKGFGVNDMHIGTFCAVAALMLLMVKHPVFFHEDSLGGKMISQFGFYSTAVYILHTVVWELYYIKFLSIFTSYFGGREELLRPLIVLTVTIVMAWGCKCFIGIAGFIRKRMLYK